MIWIYTDGACQGNPGPGGWGAILHVGDQQYPFSGHAEHTTNNRMELTAAIEGLRSALAYSHDPVTLASDSRYVVDGITKWIQNWEKNGWKTSQKKPVENKDLWENLKRLSDQFTKLSFTWVQGHSGHPLNDAADRLANSAIRTQGDPLRQ